MCIYEPEREVKLVGEYDVAVAGGGIAGIAAALAAARAGAKTVLIEGQYLLGGLATAGLVTIYLPLCDGNGKQVSYGIAEELLRLSVKHGVQFETDGSCRGYDAWLNGGTAEDRKKQRFEVRFNASLFAILCEELLQESGVEILYGCHIANVLKNGPKITALILEEKAGRTAIAAKSFVDATGDADVCRRAGAPTVRFKQGNVLAAWYYAHEGDQMNLYPNGFCDVPDKYKSLEEKQKDVCRYAGMDAKDLTAMTVASHASVKNHFLSGGGIRPDHEIASIATIPQVRMTCRLDGAYTMNDTQMHCRFADSVGLFADWRKAGPIYELPFSTLYCNEIDNLLVAGRCISVTDDMWDITRVIPVAAVSGEAAGTAAAMTDNFAGMDIAALQQKLLENGVRLHEEELPD